MPSVPGDTPSVIKASAAEEATITALTKVRLVDSHLKQKIPSHEKIFCCYLTVGRFGALFARFHVRPLTEQIDLKNLAVFHKA